MSVITWASVALWIASAFAVAYHAKNHGRSPMVYWWIIILVGPLGFRHPEAYFVPLYGALGVGFYALVYLVWGGKPQTVICTECGIENDVAQSRCSRYGSEIAGRQGDFPVGFVKEGL